MRSAPAIECLFAGPIPYREGLRLMEAAAAGVLSGAGAFKLLMFEHPPVITSGVRRKPGSLLIAQGELAKKGVEFHASDRGGDLTWHGPGQLVGYPVTDLNAIGMSIPAFVKALEAAMIGWLDGRGLACVAIEGKPGVWAGPGLKIASIGLAVRRGITTHGFALNLHGPMPGSEFIVPCGLGGARLVTLEEMTGLKVTPEAASRELAELVASRLGLKALFNHWDADCKTDCRPKQ